MTTRAAGSKHIALIREGSRQTVAEFIRSLLREEQWGEDRCHAIKVVFADEDVADPEALDVTIELE